MPIFRESASTRCSTSPAWSSSRAACCSTPTSTSSSAIVDRRLRALASDVLGRARCRRRRPTRSRSRVAAARCRSARAGSTSTACSPRTTARRRTIRPSTCSIRCWPSAQFADPIPYGAQPYLPNPPALPTAGRHLVYLDVWNREVTHLERPELVETAVGVETSSRVQTVWQVRVLDAGCRPAPPARRPTPTRRLERRSSRLRPAAHHRHLRRAAGRRPVRAAAHRRLPRAREPDLSRRDPRPRPAGRPAPRSSGRARTPASAAASRAWSRPPSSSSQTLGRDDVLRFNTGDWVEIIDDVRELSQRRGEMRTHHRQRGGAAHHVHAARCRPRCCRRRFPDSDFPRDRNLRVRRWDQKHEVFRTAAGGTPSVPGPRCGEPTGVINVPAAGTTLLLENGVTVSFALDRRQGISRRRLLGVRRAHGRRVGRSCSIARRRAASTITTRGSASGTSPPARSPTAATPGRRAATATTAAAPPA